MRLADIEAQEIAVRVLRRSIRSGSITHAYLFTGPRSVGKTTAALAFAAALNCTSPGAEGDACGACKSCLHVQAGTHPDIRLIHPQGNQTKIEQVQELIHGLSYAPLEGRYAVRIVEQADTLNPSSENCMLKILEEPPPYAVLILLSANPNSLLPTIRSRCRVVRFRRANLEEVEQALQKRMELPREELRVFASCAEGAIGKAINLAEQDGSMDERRAVLQAVQEWTEGPPLLSLKTAEYLRRIAEPDKNAPEGQTLVRNLSGLLDFILSWYADVLTLKVNPGARVTNVEYAEALKQAAGMYSLERLQESIHSIMATRQYLERNITPQLALENMLFDLHPQHV